MLMRYRQTGMSLVEAMVAVAILGSGLLGLAAMQGRALVAAQSAQYRSVAADLATNLAERIRANRSPFVVMEGSSVHASLAASLPPDFSTCVASGSVVTCPQITNHQKYLVETDMKEWIDSLSQLPNSSYTLVVNSDEGWRYRYTLTITWADDRKSSSSDFSYTAVIE